MNSNENPFSGLFFQPDPDQPPEAERLKRLDLPVYAVNTSSGCQFYCKGKLSEQPTDFEVLGGAGAVLPESLGDPTFRAVYGRRYALYAGAMANAIASEDLVIQMGRAGMMASFGAGGCSPERIEQAIKTIQQALPNGGYAFNLLNSPNEPAIEQRTVDLYLHHRIRVVEASAYLALTPALVQYRAAGLSRSPDGSVQIDNRVIAKISRKETARRFLEPAPQDLLDQLAAEGKISPEQAELARLVPVADDITVEADSGGHTDNRPLIGALPAILNLRDEIQAARAYAQEVRIGAAGGIATPASVLAAFQMGAAYVVTGSVNQSCLEAGASEHTRRLLAQAESTDVAMAPAGDMFEMGVRVQVLKRGTMFAMRAQKLYELYQRYESLEAIPAAEKEKLESTVFRKSFEEVWQECERFFGERDPRQIERARQNPHDRMALVFRWYLGLSSRWSNRGEAGREMDYQIWCGPAMGAFNDWARGSYLEDPANRRAADIGLQLLTGAAYLARVRMLETQGIRLKASERVYRPEKALI